MKPQNPKKEHYAYSKHGSCSILATIEPKTGKRLVHVEKQRTKKEFTQFMQHVASNYPDAEKIVVVLDNLNTHKQSVFYEFMDAESAEKLANRFIFIYTPNSASWLNMIELEFSSLSRLCLNRRIPSIEQLKNEVLQFFKERTEKQIKINWQFSCENAKEKLNTHYKKVYSENLKYSKS